MYHGSIYYIWYSILFAANVTTTGNAVTASEHARAHISWGVRAKLGAQEASRYSAAHVKLLKKHVE